MSVNLVVAVWFGPRQWVIPDVLKLVPYPDTDYIKRWVGILSKIEHDIAQVTFVCPAHQCDEIRALNLPSHLGRAKVKILYKPHMGISYWSWQYAVSIFDDFDYTICVEDDYMPVVSGFEKIMTDFDESSCDFFINYYKPNQAVLMTGTVHKSKYNKFCEVSDHVGDDMMSHFLYGLKTVDFPDPYHCGYYFGFHDKNAGLMKIGSGTPLFAPSQMINPQTFELNAPDNLTRLTYD